MGAAFLFGKLPSHGDFVSRGLTLEIEQVWDRWAGSELESARQALGDAFDLAHEASPPWGFVSGPGPLGQGWRCGAIAPSVDSAGRRYLLIAGVDGLAPETAAFLGLRAVGQAEAAIRAALVDGLDADATVRLLDVAPSTDHDIAKQLGAKPTDGVWWSLPGLTAPAVGNGPPEGLVAKSLEEISALKEDAA